MSGHSDFGILSKIGASSQFYLGVCWHGVSWLSVSQSGSRARTSMTFAAVICDADEPCSVNAACAPESSLTMSPRSTTPPLVHLDLPSATAKEKIIFPGDVSHFSSCSRTSDTFVETNLTSDREPTEDDDERLAMKIGDMPPPLLRRVF